MSAASGGSGYYDTEAEVYDETRGGRERARAAVRAITELWPVASTAPSSTATSRPEDRAAGRLLDVAGGTGIVSAELAAEGFDVVVADLSHGMLRLAHDRLPGKAVQAAADRLPVRDRSCDVVTVVWLLHLLPIAKADRVLDEAVRVLRPGGHLVTTVDKDLAHGGRRRTGGDAADRVSSYLAARGCGFVGQASFSARSPWGSSGPADAVFPVAAYRRA